MVKNSWSLLTVKGLCVQDVLELIHSLCGIVHMSCQVAIEETERVAVERKTDGNATFITLYNKQGGKTQRKFNLNVSILRDSFIFKAMFSNHYCHLFTPATDIQLATNLNCFFNSFWIKQKTILIVPNQYIGQYC